MIKSGKAIYEEAILSMRRFISLMRQSLKAFSIVNWRCGSKPLHFCSDRKGTTDTMRTMLLAKPIIVIILVAFAVACGFQERNSIILQGTAMLPSFKEGQRVQIKRFDRFEEPDLKRGDVVVFLFPNDPSASYIKRLIGLSGDTVEIREGKVIVNGQELDEPYVDSRLNQSRRSQETI